MPLSDGLLSDFQLSDEESKIPLTVVFCCRVDTGALVSTNDPLLIEPDRPDIGAGAIDRVRAQERTPSRNYDPYAFRRRWR